MRSQKGFTLIELLVVLSIIGILAGLGLRAYQVQRARGSNAVAVRLMHDARTALEASLNVPDKDYPEVALTAQATQGTVTDVNAHALYSTLQLPNHIKFQVSHDSACDVDSCIADFIQVNHCFGDQYTTYQRFGDGVDIQLIIDGKGC